jgi:hypothetical protein
MFVNYHLFCFTDFVDIQRRTDMGNSVIVLVSGQTAFFIIYALYPGIYEAYYKFLLKNKKLYRRICEFCKSK